MANDVLLTCGKCGGELPEPGPTGNWRGKCPTCDTATWVEVFPRAYNDVLLGHPGELRASEEQASCFEHPDRVAEAPCESCGRFLCGTCRVDLNDKAYCASCLERGIEDGKLPDLLPRFERYDIAALVCFGLPVSFGLLFAVFGSFADLFGGLMAGITIAIFVAIGAVPLGLVQVYRWRQPQSGKEAGRGRSANIAMLIFLAIVVFVVISGAIGIFFAMAAQSAPPAH